VYSLNIIKRIKSGRVRLAGDAVRTEEEWIQTFGRKSKGRDDSEVLDLDRRIILKLILEK
jgi:hypothetical protein